jgi:hypothetical protein
MAGRAMAAAPGTEGQAKNSSPLKGLKPIQGSSHLLGAWLLTPLVIPLAKSGLSLIW